MFPDLRLSVTDCILHLLISEILFMLPQKIWTFTELLEENTRHRRLSSPQSVGSIGSPPRIMSPRRFSSPVATGLSNE